MCMFSLRMAKFIGIKWLNHKIGTCLTFFSVDVGQRLTWSLSQPVCTLLFET